MWRSYPFDRVSASADIFIWYSEIEVCSKAKGRRNERREKRRRVIHSVCERTGLRTGSYQQSSSFPLATAHTHTHTHSLKLQRGQWERNAEFNKIGMTITQTESEYSHCLFLAVSLPSNKHTRHLSLLLFSVSSSCYTLHPGLWLVNDVMEAVPIS